MTGRRHERVAEEIREEVAGLISRGLKDPRVGFVTVTRVSLTPDLRTAHVNVGVLGDEGQRGKTMAALKQAAGFLRRELGRRVRMRHTPELVFHYDEGLDATDRVARLLAENPPLPEVEGGADAEGEGGSEGDDHDGDDRPGARGRGDGGEDPGAAS